MVNDTDLFSSYDQTGEFHDEVFGKESSVRQTYVKTVNHFKGLNKKDIKALTDYTTISFFNQGITFNVYSENKGVERIFPFDIFPRIIPNKEWEQVEKGVIQRTQAINLLLKDLYNEQKILKDGILPKDLILGSKSYCKHMKDFTPAGGVYTHISGTDIIKGDDGEYFVLEDNVRSPSGISYVLSNRQAMKRTFTDLFSKYNVQAVDDYPQQLLNKLLSAVPRRSSNEPTCVLLTPGIYNSAYYEHAFLASEMGIELVEGRDLRVENGFVYMKTISGDQKVDVIYRRIDDDFLDPKYFNKNSMLGVEGLMDVYKEDKVTIANAPGTGISDDKAVYAYMPEIIKYYLDQDPIIKNVHTYHCEREDDRKYVLENMSKLVVKPVDESGGYGVMVGSKATKKAISDYQKLILANPRKYIAQPIMPLSVHTTFIDKSKTFEQRHVDLRVFSLVGKEDVFVCKGGLSRVALRKGSLIVNSSQGGGSKDTWVLDKD
ncbi:circularly permuted type 2 ATP-grasp protein [Flammeovirgaceae bacterium SG7u.111]|nr:circularly permuted type 2 ATP-grasp protein [Flammeovirgaceae bacterium SG7u.132]WPO33976.1 circularly permuted type 2 ATP-grasp protein [Flammeovirgaceae bacterium SG7u.111]